MTSEKNYQQIEQGKIVVYMTSMMIIRDTYEDCQRVRKMLQNHMVQYEERDIFMSRNNQLELAERLGQKSEVAAKISVPQVFADGVHIGGADEMERLNETGQLRILLQHYKRVTQLTSCSTCGGYRFIPCTSCHGSKKSLHRNHFTEEFSALRCIVCDENGLIRCSECCPDS
ncbi:hypothetical protein CAPTEDRAFT_204051 [Capitella teleta]|uniref:Glutaredoxin domain-containing protein n=1 Tax=Capitella teleta TaxID=283909 RepID=R7VD49_CAPTE|nr:hypothetical protein CAPTEDRAFT_204051 [Capitella teleta]|eukprot:ELU13610.1 hypothetical protein CAPTEDRAFT_204051 [Capitella teleta]